MRFLRRIVLLLFLPAGLQMAQAFVMIGPMATNRLTTTNAGPTAINLNYTDDLGGPKERKSFYRWNMPSLTYAFDASFINYFGLEGRSAINEAMGVINDFFSNEDYAGMSNLDLAASGHGFHGNYNTTWINTTAQNLGILDIKSLTLGLMVNQLGLGNPHRYAFSIRDATTNQASTIINFRVRLNNFDPITENPIDMINNVKYSYRLVHDGTNSVGINSPNFIMPSSADMEEFTTDTGGNAWTAVAGIADAFYGNTALFWTDTPTLYNFGVYYDGKNAMGDKYKPRHALTYDDAGGLRYLYRKDNYVYETMPSNVVLVIPEQLIPTTTLPVFPGVPTGRLFPDSLGGNQGFVPHRQTSDLMQNWGVSGWSITSTIPAPEPPIFYDLALRGGVDTIQLIEQPFDSLIGITFTPTTLTWTDRFVTPSNGALKFATQKVGRAVFMPDIIFVTDDLGLAPDGVPIGWNRTDSSQWIDNYTNALGPVMLAPGSTNKGPGIIMGPVQFTFTKIHEEFEVLWSGESSVMGNMDDRSLWGHIRGPGPNDIVVFPRDVRHALIENAISPAENVPTISMVSDNKGINAIDDGPIEGQDIMIADGVYTRTTETLTLTGRRLASVSIIEIMAGSTVLQRISPATEFIVSNARIDIPPGVISNNAEGTGRTVRVWNTVGYSNHGPEGFTIETGAPVITSTGADGLIYDRAEPLKLQGYGFMSAESGAAQIAYIRVDESNGTAAWPSDDNVTAVAINVQSDTWAELDAGAVSALADGSNRYLRVSRIADNTQLSPIDNVQLIAAISSKPVITSYTAASMAPNGGEFRRDMNMDINGTALNTTYKIEVIQADGTPFNPELAIDLPHPGVFVEDGGTRIQISANVFLSADADSNTTDINATFKIHNALANSDRNASLHFHVNLQPQIDFIGAFASAGALNRDIEEGDDIFIFGSGLKAVGEIHLIDADGNGLNSSIEANATGVTITDTSISIDTSQIQFSNPGNADSRLSSQYRLFALYSARDLAISPRAQQFNVGAPPKFSSLGGIANNHYRRDADTLEVNGTGLGMITRVEIVDSTGVSIPNLNAINTNGGVILVSPQSITLEANDTGWRPTIHHADSVAALSRRLPIITPFGTITTDANSSGAFTISATPSFYATAQATFSGGGYDVGGGIAGIYDLSEGALHISGKNLRGVKQIALEDNASTNYATLTLNPDAPPSGIVFNQAGTQITISAATITSHNATWASNDSSVMKRVTLVSTAGQNATSPEINTQP